MIKFLDLNNQYLKIKNEINDAIFNVIESSEYINGKFNREFEENFSKFIGVNHCIGVGNGTDALEIALTSLELPLNSEIVVPANTFVATAEAVIRSGHKVIFADVDEETYLINGKTLASAITPNTKAVIAVHLYGQSCDIGSIKEVCDKHSLYLIEDCAQAHGAKFQNQSIGKFGDVNAFSFYPGKNLGAYGDAGAITTNNSLLSEKCRKIANHGRVAKYDHEFVGRNSRLDGMQAAILTVKLRHLDLWVKQRNIIAAFYLENLKGLGDLILPVCRNNVTHAYHLFVIRTKYRNELCEYLKTQGIETGIHYPIALPKLKAFNTLPMTEDLVNSSVMKNDSRILSLPVGEHLSLNQAKLVVNFVRDFFENN
jgi:dTDP-4-amino-4,6-dideoxygalactose transaminase